MIIKKKNSRKSSEIASILSTNLKFSNKNRLNSLTPSPDSQMTFQKIEQVREYYLNLIEDHTPNQKLQESRQNKIKGLEEIGIFSEFDHSKKIYSENEKKLSPKTIHISDFMRKDQKMKLLQLAGECQVYENRKESFRRELFNRESAYKKFFLHSEKNPKFFNTPQASPRVLKDLEVDRKVLLVNSHSEKTSKIDGIIDKCNKAIKTKPVNIFNL